MTMRTINRKPKSLLQGLLAAALALAAVASGCQKKEMDRATALQVLAARHLGLAYLEDGKLTEAGAEFQKVVELAPDEALGYANLAVIAMRQDNYTEAETLFKNALKRDPKQPTARLNLSEIYRQTGREAQGLKLLQDTAKEVPEHVRTLFQLAQIYLSEGNDEQKRQATELLERLVELRPANLMARMYLVEALLRVGDSDRAAEHMEIIRGLLPVLADQTLAFYKSARQLMLAGNADGALPQAVIFHNLLKGFPFYRAGALELFESTTVLLGFPVTELSPAVTVQMATQGTITDAIHYVDVTSAAGLDVPAPDNVARSVAVADYDSDGDEDVYLGALPATSALLLANDGQFKDIADSAGLHHDGTDLDAVFVDYDNDGFLDLFVVNDAANRLYKNVGVGKFEEVAASAGLANSENAKRALFADYDHDGDLDLYLLCDGRNRYYRNNLDGTFSDLSASIELCQGKELSHDAVFADFDDDGDLDVFIANSSGGNVIFSNKRQGHFENISAKALPAQDMLSRAAAIGDYNNDGLPDLFVAGKAPSQSQLLVNLGTAFVADTTTSALSSDLDKIVVTEAEFMDFDNDGFLDLLLVASADNAGRRLHLFRGLGGGKFEDRSSVIPDSLGAVQSVAPLDYDNDGDLDLLTTGADGRVHLLRNDGGNANGYLKIQLVGVRTGSGKNNGFGIGAKMEVRAQELYQSHTIDAPISHFGLGQRSRAEVVRVLWPNGSPQNMIDLKRDQFFVEKQVLKGSCLFLYAWNGEKYEFTTDVMWRSALGMPLGIMGGETQYAFANSSQDYFRIPGDALVAKDGVYAIQITEELWETAFLDQLKLLAVDHPDSIDIFVDERFVPPPIPPLRIFTARKDKRTPISATDDNGRDLLPEILALDNNFVATFEPERYQGLTELHDLVLDFGDLKNSERILLFLNGWIFPSDASINVALAQGKAIKPNFPQLQIKDKNGHWQTVVENLSFPMGKKKFMITDLTGKFASDDYRLRIRTNMQIYWDFAFVSNSEPQADVVRTELAMTRADLHYRGFSRPYRLASRFGPHWFDYADVDTNQKWRDLIGKYTRFGDVLPLLRAPDDMMVVANSGDEITIEFDVNSAPELPQGWRRDFIVYTDGWVKDGDLNTAYGKTVEPLPFQHLSRYPYGSDEAYPNDARRRAYLREYQTREVTTDGFRTALRRKGK